jgi:hypothetical protein
MATTLRVYFGEAQTGLGYQFYDAAGELLGSRVTTGITSLPTAGSYSISVTVPSEAAGIYWSSDSAEASESFTTLQVFFGEDQTGVGYQFYDADGAFLGERVTTGIIDLPEAGGYAVDVTVPELAAGIYWDSDTSEASESVEAYLSTFDNPLEVAQATGEGGMLDAGFGTLDALKARVLPAVMDSYDGEGEWDEDLRQLGLATAHAINRYCNRVLQRGTGVTWDSEGGVRSFVVDRYPVEQVSALKITRGSGTEDVLDRIYLVKPDSGIVELTGYLGCYRDRITCTYSGGYWLGTTGTQFSTVTAAVAAGVTQVTVIPPNGFTSAHAVAASIERLSGDGQLTVANFDASGNNVVVTFGGTAVDAENFQVLVRFEKEPDTTPPDGAIQLPGDIYNAWVMQTQAAMEHTNLLRGAGVQRAGDPSGTLTELEFLPHVREILNPYKRWR